MPLGSAAPGFPGSAGIPANAIPTMKLDDVAANGPPRCFARPQDRTRFGSPAPGGHGHVPNDVTSGTEGERGPRGDRRRAQASAWRLAVSVAVPADGRARKVTPSVSEELELETAMAVPCAPYRRRLCISWRRSSAARFHKSRNVPPF